MNYSEKLKVMTDFVNDNFDCVEDLCVAFDITLENVVNLFPDKLVSNYSKYFPSDVEDEGEDEYEKEAWSGFRVYSEEE